MGNDQSKQKRVVLTTTSAGVGVGLIITSIICPPLGVVATTTYAASGIATTLVGKATDCEELEAIGDAVTLGAAIGGVGGTVVGGIQGSHACGTCKNLPKAFK